MKPLSRNSLFFLAFAIGLFACVNDAKDDGGDNLQTGQIQNESTDATAKDPKTLGEAVKDLPKLEEMESPTPVINNERVEFPPNSNKVTIERQIFARTTYYHILTIGEGRVLNIEVTADNPRTKVVIFAPEGNTLFGGSTMEGSVTWSGKASTSGDFTVEVELESEEAHKNGISDYTLNIVVD